MSSTDRQQLLDWIERDREALVAFLAGFVRAPSPNPPGDTREAVDFLRRYLAEAGVPHRIAAAKPELPNLIGSFDGVAPGRHLVLNGHVDVFPAGDDAGRRHPPWSGAIEDGKIWGRGVVDMKCGTAASVMAYCYLHRMRDRLKGRLALTAVSDEETGGTWGTRWLIEQFPDEALGDCCLNGEPGTPGTIRFGEKGTLRLIFTVTTPGAHAAYTHLSANAIHVASRIILALETLQDLAFDQPSSLRQAIERGAPVIDRLLGAGGARILNRVTVSTGVIQGGLKINMLPGACRFEVDIRLPVGLDKGPVMMRIGEILAAHPGASVAEVTTHSNPSSWCDPEHAMVGILQRTVEGLIGSVPVPVVSLGASDTKFWRYRGVPAFIYGCTPTNMAKPDEHVAIDEFLHIVRTHTLAAHSYLT